MSLVHGTFLHNWTAKLLEQPPLIAPARTLQYPQHVPGEEEALQRGALSVMVSSDRGGSFLGNFALGFAERSLPSGIWSCPDPNDLCVVAGGYAYIVNSIDPESFCFINIRPVVSLYTLASPPLLLFVGINDIAAWGPSGLAWKTARLSWEGLRITQVDSKEIRGFGWNMLTDREVEFSVNPNTGEHSGGGFQAP